jgi:hypothetical protein
MAKPLRFVFPFLSRKRSIFSCCQHSLSVFFIPQFLEPSSKLAQLKSLTFHSCVDRDMTQEEFFPISGIKQSLLTVFQGRNSTVLAYGQTGSGKTYTMSVGEYTSLKNVAFISQEIPNCGATIATNSVFIFFAGTRRYARRKSNRST